MHLPRLTAVIERKIVRYLIAAVGVSILATVVFVVRQWPRWVLMSDVGHAKTIMIGWSVNDDNDVQHKYALNWANTRENSSLKCSTKTSAWTTREESLLSPYINIVLLDENSIILANYVIRHDANGCPDILSRGRLAGARCPAMELLRDMASHGRRLSGAEVDKLTADMWEKGPDVKFPSPFRFDYTLPTVPFEGTYTLPVLPEKDNARIRKDSPRPPTPENPKGGEANPCASPAGVDNRQEGA